MMTSTNPTTFSAYLRALPRESQAALRQIRAVVKEEVPSAKGAMSYGMPSMTFGGVHFISLAAWARHVSIYPVPDGGKSLIKAMRPYRFGRGTLRFGLDRPLPIGLIRQIVRASLKRAMEKAGRIGPAYKKQ